jgi:hypothetical protein
MYHYYWKYVDYTINTIYTAYPENPNTFHKPFIFFCKINIFKHLKKNFISYTLTLHERSLYIVFDTCVLQPIRITTNFYNHLSKAIIRNIIDGVVRH